MNKKCGFSLIELMITVAIIGILSLTVMPVYKNYVLRVKIQEAIQTVTLLAREAQLALASDEWDSALDVVGISNREGLPFTPMGCARGYGYARIGGGHPDKRIFVRAFGIDMKYISAFTYFGFYQNPNCVGHGMHEKPAIEFAFSLDTVTLGIKNQTGNRYYNEINIEIAPEVTYLDKDGKMIEKIESGSIMYCGIYTRSSTVNDVSKFDFPVSALPKQCRYLMLSGKPPRKLISLDGL